MDTPGKPGDDHQEPLCIDRLIARHAARWPEAPCLTFRGRHWSYGEVQQGIEQLAAGLSAAGIEPGDRVAVLCTPRPEYLLLLMAISRARAVYVGLSPRSTASEIAHVLQTVRPRFVASLREFEGRQFPALFEQVAAGAAADATPTPVAYFDGVEACIAAVAGLASRREVAPAAPVPDAPTHQALQRSAAIVFTSGTTGQPKAAMLTHAGLLHAAHVQHDRLGALQPRYLCNLPINHVGCLMNLTLSALMGGGSIVFQERFAAAETLRLLHEEGVNTWLQVPAMFHECVQHPDYDPLSLQHLHSVCVGGGAPSAATLARLRLIGTRLFVEYGQTETSSSASYSDPDAGDEVLSHCIGRFDPRFEFRIADERDQPCATDVTGEIQGRGRLIFAGYFGDPAATASAFTADGWLKTGDLAAQRADGNIVLKGRLKEMIKSGGYNVYPREIELVLESHPAIAQVVVMGLPDEHYGEAVHAVLRLRDAGAALARAELDALCRRTLANYKVPKSFRVVDALPLLANGKVDRIGTRALAPGLPGLQ